jgi:hypothetical protein
MPLVNMRFMIFQLFFQFFWQNIIICPGKFADGGSRNPTRVLTKLAWPPDMKTAVNAKILMLFASDLARLLCILLLSTRTMIRFLFVLL